MTLADSGTLRPISFLSGGSSKIEEKKTGPAPSQYGPEYVRLVFVECRRTQSIISLMKARSENQPKPITKLGMLADIKKQASQLQLSSKEQESVYCVQIAHKTYLFVARAHFSTRGLELQEKVCGGALKGKYIVFIEGLERNPDTEQAAVGRFKQPCFGLEDSTIHLVTSIVGHYIRMKADNLNEEGRNKIIHDFMAGFARTSRQLEVFNGLVEQVAPMTASTYQPSYMGLLTKMAEVYQNPSAFSQLENFSSIAWAAFFKSLALIAMKTSGLSPEERQCVRNVFESLTEAHINTYLVEVNYKRRDAIFAEHLLA
jgi:hypothetical protein